MWSLRDREGGNCMRAEEGCMCLFCDYFGEYMHGKTVRLVLFGACDYDGGLFYVVGSV